MLLVAGQLLYWPVLPLLLGKPVPAAAAAGVTVACLLAGAALGFRRDRPAPTFAAVLAATMLAAVAAPAEPQWIEADDALLVIGVTTLVALYSVAVHAPARTALHAMIVLVVWESALTAVRDGVGADYPLVVALAVIIHGAVAALGRRRARWNAERSAAARRLDAARRAERDAADAERRRLARELHDVTAHHLTSIVVNASAAEMLAAQRPDLTEEALAFASRTGRETLDALRRLVAIMPAGAPASDEPSLNDLAEGFRALGQRITVELPDGDPPPEVAVAVYGIVREALTNTLRYAPGGQVRVRYARSELLVDDDGGSVPVTGLGGGRGLTGMRERARAAGGTCEAGPRDEGGWRVRATFPGAAETVRVAYPWLRSRTVIDGLVAVILLLVQFGGVGLAIDEGLPAAATVLVVLAQAAHAAPVLLRRRAPWWALLATALTGLLGPLLVVTGVVPVVMAYVFVLGCAVELVIVYAVASRGAHAGLTWLAILAAAGSWALTMAALMALDMSADPEITGAGPMLVPATVVVLTPILAALLAVPATACWGAGFAARRRRDRRRMREEGGVAVALHHAALHARAERLRIADGLHRQVLRHAADVPGAAERGDLTGVLGAARQALTAMRALLDGLGPAPGTSRTPPDTVHAEVTSSASE